MFLKQLIRQWTGRRNEEYWEKFNKTAGSVNLIYSSLFIPGVGKVEWWISLEYINAFKEY